MFHKIVFDRGDSSLEYFKSATGKLWSVAVGSSHISYEVKTIFVFIESYRRDNERRRKHVP